MDVLKQCRLQSFVSFLKDIIKHNVLKAEILIFSPGAHFLLGVIYFMANSSWVKP